MQARITGKKEVKFTNDKGEAIDGMTVYVLFEEQNVEGLCTDHYFLKAGTLPKDVKINDMIDITFNRKGKIEAIRKV